LALIFNCGIPIELFVNLKLDRTMSWTQVRQLDEIGITFGSHTQRHEILPRIPLARMKQEIAESKDAIREHLAKDCFLFSYPNGDASPEARDVVSSSDFKLAFINSPGVWQRDGDPFLIPRINIWENRVTGFDGQFAPLEFEYSVFWRAFIHRHRSRKAMNASIVTGDAVGSALPVGPVASPQPDASSLKPSAVSGPAKTSES
jgi:peptidoglycan/xylan/chitin deacetylase (PgdA/CDA1 family)